MTVHALHAIAASVTGVSYTLPTPVTKYSQNFNNGGSFWSAPFDGWSLTGGTSPSYAADYPGVDASSSSDSSDLYAHVTVHTVTGNTCSLQRTVTGLTIGASYTLTAWGTPELVHGTITPSIGVSGIGSSSSVVATKASFFSTTWSQYSYTFTATATSHVILLSITGTTISGSQQEDFDWDKVLLQQTTAPNFPLDIKSSTLTLDDSWSPYCQGALVCSIPAAADYARIDPRLTLRVAITASVNYGTGTAWNSTPRSPVTRTFDLNLVSRVIDAKSKEMTLSLESDEFLLRSFTKITTATNRVYGLDVATAVIHALAVIGATLQAGYSTGTLTSKTLDPVLTNLVFNPTAATATTQWAIQGVGSLSRLTGLSIPGLPNVTTAARTTLTTASIPGIYWAGDQNTAIATTVAPSTSYVLSMWVRVSVATTVSINCEFTNASFAITRTVIGSPVSVAANTWTRLSTTVSTSTTETHVGIFCNGFVNQAIGTTFDGTAAMVEIGSTGHEYFDGGNSASRDSTVYVHAWTGTANASTSTLTEQPNNDAMIWQPGTSAMDWVLPIVQAAGLHLYCDETRNWYLVQTVMVGGNILITSETGITGATDTISLEDQTDFCVGVLVQYNAPADPVTGLTPAPQYDFAGLSAGPVKVIVYDNTPYPGPGAAAAVLARATGKGHEFDVSAESDYTTTPGIALTIALPDGTAQSGSVSSVTFNFGGDDHGTMTVGSTGLVDTPANAWALAIGTWAAATGTWAGATGTN